MVSDGLILIFSATVTNLQQKLEGFQTANTLMKEDIRIAKSNIVLLQQENLNLRRDKESLLDQHHHQMQVRRSAIRSELDVLLVAFNVCSLVLLFVF